MGSAKTSDASAKVGTARVGMPPPSHEAPAPPDCGGQELSTTKDAAASLPKESTKETEKDLTVPAVEEVEVPVWPRKKEEKPAKASPELNTSPSPEESSQDKDLKASPSMSPKVGFSLPPPGTVTKGGKPDE